MRPWAGKVGAAWMQADGNAPLEQQPIVEAYIRPLHERAGVDSAVLVLQQHRIRDFWPNMVLSNLYSLTCSAGLYSGDLGN